MIRWFLFSGLIVASIILGIAYRDYHQFLNHPSENDQAVVFEVMQGDSLGVVSSRLQEAGLINNNRWFKLLAFKSKAEASIKTGVYSIQPATTPVTILSTLVAGRVNQYSITFVEGWSFKQLLQVLGKNVHIKQTITGMSYDAIMSRLGYPGQHPEGRFFPETYFFINNTSDLDILKRAYEKMQKNLTEEWENRDRKLPLKTPYEALILASIIEKETGRAGERAEIAGVFIRRLRKNMLLQTDPTVIYGMGERYKGNIRRKDLRTDTPYNTYTRFGLPPTPIAMPGQAALHAAVHPKQGDTLFFVAKGNGSHIFSATLKQHNQAVNQYQKKQRVKQ
ncbi:MAG TPA: endolytic transglycosylase MltG [Crenotrichaceae bacterium]|nr:endolytic transglycosylase MltG [Crenotrichaceae bacterium]